MVKLPFTQRLRVAAHALTVSAEQLDLAIVDADCDLAVGRSRQCRVVGAIDLNESSIIDGALALLEVSEALGGQRP
jgi:hypothetical protein